MAEHPAYSLAVSISLDPYLPLKVLSGYSGIGVRKLREYLADPVDPLPCYRPPGGGKVLVRRSEFDAWIARFRTRGLPGVDAIVNEVLTDLRAGE